MQHPVFYDPAIPHYLSYGAFGSVSGHELSHAFDSSGRHYDETGNFTEWWNNETIHAFKEKAQCFIDQYHGFTVPGSDGKPLHVNGRLTLGENIADAGGLSASFLAWRDYEKEYPGELLPGLQGFSKDQMFFISYSNWWCGKIRKEAAIDRIYRDPHAPTWARIIVGLLPHKSHSSLTLLSRERWRIPASSGRASTARKKSQPANCGRRQTVLRGIVEIQTTHNEREA